ncbi:MAG: TetR/AcrR family transcriptional regulator [Acidimicrobiales bacterium]
MPAARSRQHESRCVELVGVARELLVEGGLDAFAMRAVAARADMKLGNLQYYFAARDDLLEAVIRTDFAQDLAAFQDASAAVAGPASLKRLARRLVANWSSSNGIAFVTLSTLAYHNDRFRSLNREIYESFYDELRSMIRRLDEDAPGPEVALRARLMTSVLDGVALQIHAGAGGGKAADTKLIDRAADLLISIATGP